ncbi:uncharacterized protein Triagg1_5565 [Trichoderma aggressivum f. europaeum]|uniref:Transposase-like protein n=1 Tax=Trichoderma aggressivum f. europaeum TaxID=173218 RepID=A0AAE1IE73_9HYPO|nr:hypothetical protein Triagg1_5565 [Trichoderma aggressivum f. europaeum]
MASSIVSVIQKWDTQYQLGTIVGDNALNNDTCVQHLFSHINPSISASDAIDRRMRCYGHILNLVGRAFLYGEDNEAFEQESQLFDLTGRLDDEVKHWRKKGAVGKLRNIVKFIRSSIERSERFENTATALGLDDQELEVIMNNDTRWNSTYMMISRALDK